MRLLAALRELRTVAGRVSRQAEESSDASPQYDVVDVDRLCELFIFIRGMEEESAQVTNELIALKVLPFKLEELGACIDRIRSDGGSLRTISRLAFLTLIYTSEVDGEDTREALESPPTFSPTEQKKPSRVG